MEEMNNGQIYELSWQNLVRILTDARKHSIRQDLEIQHVINLLAHLEEQLPITAPQDVPEEENE